MKKAWLVALAGLMFAGVALAEDDLLSVEKQIVEKWYKHESLTAKFTMETQLDMGGMGMQQKGEGTIETLRKGEKVLSRMEMKISMTQKMGEQEQKFEQNLLSVVDGEVAYMLSDAMGQKMAHKTKADPMSTGNPRAMFEQLRKDHDLKLLPDEMVGGDKSYAIEATAKQAVGRPGEPTRMVLYFAHDDGAIRKLVAYNGDKLTTTMLWADIKLDAKIDPERFVFKAPEGVVVQDMTNMPTGE